jgi:valyl-tRNA synthetase
MTAKYPKAEDVVEWRNAELEGQMELLRSIARASRSMRVSLNLTSKKVPLFVSCGTAEGCATISQLSADITLLSQSSACSAQSADEQRPAGCLSSVINAQFEIHVLVAGLNELAVEAVKREKSLAGLEQSIATIRAKMAAPGFSQSSEEVQKGFLDKLNLQATEAKVLQESIGTLTSMFSDEQRTKYIEAKV